MGAVGVGGVAGACCGFCRLSRSLQVFLLCQEIYRLFHGVCALMIYCMWCKRCIPAVVCCVLALLGGHIGVLGVPTPGASPPHPHEGQ